MEVFDFYHAVENLQQFAKATFTELTVVKTWFKQARKDLKGHICDLIHRMQSMVEKASGERSKIIAGQLAYFIKGQQQGNKALY